MTAMSSLELAKHLGIDAGGGKKAAAADMPPMPEPITMTSQCSRSVSVIALYDSHSRGLICPFATFIETVQPIQYLVRGQVYPANLTVLVSTFLRGKHPLPHGSS